jgi:beta-N-acetylhexosaminidase
MGRHLWVAIDQEGGPVQRLIPPFIQLPSARNMATQGPEAISEWSARAASELRKIGIHINLAPVLDVVPEGRTHFMTERSLGSDSKQVAQLGRIWIKTLQEQGISATGKHYPGLGRAALDPHHYAPVIRWENDEAMEEDLLPFRQAITAGVHCIMTSHALYPDMDGNWPATLSPTINHEWLRNRLGFQGILFSDDMDMASVSARYTFEEMARQGLDATLDFFLLCQQTSNIELLHRALADAISRGQNMAGLHRRSLMRIDRFKALRDNPG